MSPARLALAAALLLTVTTLPAATASAQYPTPLPDFAHPATPHFSLLSPSAGTRDRPLLALYLAFEDLGFNANVDAAVLSRRVFGTGLADSWPSSREYLRRVSFGHLDLFPAAETDTSRNGAVNDGVVALEMPFTDAEYKALGPTGEIQTALEALGDRVDFRPFDTNNDGAIGNDELVIQIFKTLDAPLPAGDGAVFPQGNNPPLDVTVDTKKITGFRRAGLIAVTTNLMTIAHETGHIAFDMFDMYTYPTGVGRFDIAGGTVIGDDSLWAPAAWWKLHAGWITPTVVTQDGYYDVRQAGDQNPEAFLLYDPDHGVEEYFLVENRQALANTSDAGTEDSGLVVWRVRDTGASSINPAGPPFEIMRPDGVNSVLGDGADAFDPVQGGSLQRAMTAAWKSGPAAKVAVRAVGRSGPTMRAYFDVRGPGVLVDSWDYDSGGPPLLAALTPLFPGDPNEITFPVMNTGEATGSFDFTITGPPGWSATTHSMTLAAGQSATATVQLTPPLEAPAGTIYPLELRGRASDGSVSSTAPLRVRVYPKLSIDDVTVTEGDAGTQDATVTVSRSEEGPELLSFDVESVDGTATAPEDYETVRSTTGNPLHLSFGGRANTLTFPVRIKGDTTPEPDEHLLVRLVNAPRAKIVDPEGRITILTDPEPSLSIDDVRVTEDDTTAAFTVSLSEANNTPVTVRASTADASAAAPADYTTTSADVAFPVGVTTRTFSVPVREDFADEIDEESFRVNLTQVANANIGDGQGVGTIRDDDRNGEFSCRASGIRIGDSEGGVANPARIPCRDALDAAPLTLGLGLLSVTLTNGKAVTDQTPNSLTGTAPQAGDRATAHAEATEVVIRSGLTVIRVAGLFSDAAATCTGSGPPVLSGSSKVTVLSLAGQPVVTATAQTTIPLVLATLRLNQRVVGPSEITQRALVLDNVIGPDIVIGEARAGFTGTAVHPNGHPCVV